MSNLVHFAGSKEDLKKLVQETAKLVVLDFYADWCGPCKYLGKEIPKAAEKYPNVKFLKTNVDKSPEFAYEYGVDTIPQLKFFKNGVKKDPTEPIDTIVGADIPKLYECIERLK